MVAGQEDSASRFRRRCDPEVVVLRVVSAPQVEDRKVRIGIDDLGKPRVDPDDFSEQAPEVSHARSTPVPLAGESEDLALRYGGDQRAVCPRREGELVLDPDAGCILPCEVDQHVRIEQDKGMAEMDHEVRSSQAAISSSVSSPGQRPKIAETPDLGPWGYGARKDRSAVSSAMGCGTRERIRPPP